MNRSLFRVGVMIEMRGFLIFCILKAYLDGNIKVLAFKCSHFLFECLYLKRYIWIKFSGNNEGFKIITLSLSKLDLNVESDENTILSSRTFP